MKSFFLLTLCIAASFSKPRAPFWEEDGNVATVLKNEQKQTLRDNRFTVRQGTIAGYVDLSPVPNLEKTATKIETTRIETTTIKSAYTQNDPSNCLCVPAGKCLNPGQAIPGSRIGSVSSPSPSGQGIKPDGGREDGEAIIDIRIVSKPPAKVCQPGLVYCCLSIPALAAIPPAAPQRLYGSKSPQPIPDLSPVPSLDTTATKAETTRVETTTIKSPYAPNDPSNCLCVPAGKCVNSGPAIPVSRTGNVDPAPPPLSGEGVAAGGGSEDGEGFLDIRIVSKPPPTVCPPGLVYCCLSIPVLAAIPTPAPQTLYGSKSPKPISDLSPVPSLDTTATKAETTRVETTTIKSPYAPNDPSNCLCVPAGKCVNSGPAIPGGRIGNIDPAPPPPSREGVAASGGSKDGEGILDIRIVYKPSPIVCQPGLVSCCLSTPALDETPLAPQRLHGSESPTAVPGGTIYNGTGDEIGRFPYLVSLQSNHTHFCAGVIYDNDLIITAAQCLESRKPEEVHIIAGRLVPRSNEEHILTAHSFLLHPSYFRNNTVVRNNIALIRTSQRFSWNSAVQASIVNPNWTYDVDESISLVRWSATKRRDQSTDHPLSAVSYVQNDDACKKAFSGPYEPESTFCLYTEGKDFCRGVGGSPTINQHNQIVGLVSYGGKLCGRKPLVATRINYYLQWIEEQRKQINDGTGETVNRLNIFTKTELTSLHASVIQRQTLESSHEELCGSTWKFNCFGDECFCYTLLNSRLTWLEAEMRCGLYGGALTSIMSGEENSFVGKFVPSWFAKIWIGLNGLKTNGILVWPEQNLNYTSWHYVPQPNPKFNECVDMDYYLQWQTSDCATALPSVCKVPVSEKGTSHKCELGWAFFEGFCYQMQASPLSWEAASRNCKRKQADLASVHDSFENNFVMSVISDAGEEYVWIGLNDEEEDGIFDWSDDSLGLFRNWQEGEPNSSISEEYCVGIWMPSGLWNDYRCSLQLPSLCKKEAS